MHGVLECRLEAFDFYARAPSGPGLAAIAQHPQEAVTSGNGMDRPFSGLLDLECPVSDFNGAFAEIRNNTITGNGRDSHGEAGVQMLRAVAVGQRNTIANNDYASIAVFNFGTCRTGSFIVTTQPNNDGPFETISVGAGGVVAPGSKAITGLAVRYRLS